MRNEIELILGVGMKPAIEITLFFSKLAFEKSGAFLYYQSLHHTVHRRKVMLLSQTY